MNTDGKSVGDQLLIIIHIFPLFKKGLTFGCKHQAQQQQQGRYTLTAVYKVLMPNVSGLASGR